MVQDNEPPTTRLIELIAELALVVAVTDDFDFTDEHTVIDSAEGIDDLWMMEGFAEALNRASYLIVQEIRRRIGEDVKLSGTVRLGDNLYRMGKVGKPYVVPELMDWLGADAGAAFNINHVRKTSVEAIAKRRGEDPKVVIDTFFIYESEEGERIEELVKVHRSKWPKYAQGMKHGERR